MSLIFFIAAILIVAIVAILVFVKSPLAYFKSKEGRGVLFGIVASVLGVAGIALIAAICFKPQKAEAFEYLSSAEVYLGLDSTRKISPMCDTGVNSDKLTSNLGVKTSLIKTDDSRANVNLKYTHHSCAFNPDHLSYDALGIEITYMIW